MIHTFSISNSDWLAFLLTLSRTHTVYIPVKTFDAIDYKVFDENTQDIAYNAAKPLTPLKTFFLPVKANVVIEKNDYNKNVIIGIPSCDLKAIDILDAIYLDPSFVDPDYKKRRDNSILIGTDCFTTAENCHCTSYGIEPWPSEYADASLVSLEDTIVITVRSPKGEDLFRTLSNDCAIGEVSHEILQKIERKREEVKAYLEQKNKILPDYAETGRLIRESGDEVWMRHAKTCVSCGACATACPTCTCFLLIDRPDFEKVRQLDACQYPGFEKIAAGEDPLGRKFVRFRNRYLCKYVWKPEGFGVSACTGCGRCIDSCIGNISKNRIFTEMKESL